MQKVSTEHLLANKINVKLSFLGSGWMRQYNIMLQESVLKASFKITNGIDTNFNSLLLKYGLDSQGCKDYFNITRSFFRSPSFPNLVVGIFHPNVNALSLKHPAAFGERFVLGLRISFFLLDRLPSSINLQTKHHLSQSTSATDCIPIHPNNLFRFSFSWILF